MFALRREPTVVTVEELLQQLARSNGSDLFVTTGAPPMMSVEGRLVPVGRSALRPADVERLIRPLIRDPDAFAVRPEIDTAMRLPNGDRFRLNVYRQRGALALVARRIRARVQRLEELGLPRVLGEMALRNKGLVLVTGATGSGKSTTLAAMIDHRSRTSAGHIVTLEDPIEFIHEHQRSLVSQREIGVDTASFADALRSALRQAPDVLLVGEIRDRETAEAALQFAETGHLVLATLHSTNASQTLERLLGLFPADRHVQIQMLLALNLEGVVSQRLVPALDGTRAAALEVLVPTARIRHLIKRGETDAIRDAVAEGTRDGMTTFDQSLIRLLGEGRISLDNAITYADSPTDLRLAVSTKGARDQVDAGLRLL